MGLTADSVVFMTGSIVLMTAGRLLTPDNTVITADSTVLTAGNLLGISVPGVLPMQVFVVECRPVSMRMASPGLSQRGGSPCGSSVCLPFTDSAPVF